jgi:hypothetical protein
MVCAFQIAVETGLIPCHVTGMTILQLEKEISRLDRKNLCRFHEKIEDIIDAIDAQKSHQLVLAGEKGIPWRELKKQLDAKWSVKSTK